MPGPTGFSPLHYPPDCKRKSNAESNARPVLILLLILTVLPRYGPADTVLLRKCRPGSRSVCVLDDDFAEELVSGGGCFQWSWRASWCPEGSFQLLSKCVLSSYHTAGLVQAPLVSGRSATCLLSRSEVAGRRPASATSPPVLVDL